MVNDCDHKLEIRDRFRIAVLGHQFPDAAEFYDRNWLIVTLSAKDEVSAVAINGPHLLTFELRNLFAGVRDLLAGRTSEFAMPTTEHMLELSLKKRDNLGHFGARLVLRSDLSRSGPDDSRSVHEYEFGIDQTDLQILERQLDKILGAYPVIGRP